MEIRQRSFILCITILECLRGTVSSSSENSFITHMNRKGGNHLQTLLSNSHTFNKRSQIPLSSEAFRSLHEFLISVSPPHNLFLLYEDAFEEHLSLLITDTNFQEIRTVTKFTSDVESVLATLLAPSASSIVRRNILVLCTLKNMRALFKMVSIKNLESPFVWWILILKEGDAAQILDGTLREGSQVILIQPSSEISAQFLTSSVNSSGMVNFREVGSWRQTSYGYRGNLAENVFVDLDKVYSNFGGRHLKVTANNDPPFIFLQRKATGEYSVSGFESSILRAMGNTLNFTYEISPPPDSKWGGPLGNGTVIGMIGVVHRREATFAICEITITGKREEVIDFTYPYYVESLSLVSRAPTEKNPALAVFTPFTSDVWLYIALSTVIVGLILAAQSWILSSYISHRSRAYNLNNFLFSVYRSLVKQENLLLPDHWSFKITFIIWYIFTFLISVLYPSTLISTLVKPSFEKPINSLLDLPDANKNGFTLVVTGDSSIEYLFKYATQGIYSDTWKLFNHKDRSKSFPRSSNLVYDGVLTDKLIIIKSNLALKYQNAVRGIHQFYLAKETFSPQFYGVACFPGAPFQDKFSKLLSYMNEGGLISKWLDTEFFKVTGGSSSAQETGPRAFTLLQLQASFYILLLGYGIASVCLAAENIFSKCMVAY